MFRFKQAGIIILLSLLPSISLYAQESSDMVYYTGLHLAANGYFQEARQKFDIALKRDPLSVAARMNLDVVEQVLSDFLSGKAAMYYFKAIELGNEERYNDKIGLLDSALTISPGFGLAYNEMGIAYVKKEQYDSAIISYNKAIALIPDRPEIYFNKALSCDKIGEYGQAVDSYEKFLEKAGDYNPIIVLYATQRIREIRQPDSP
ncbi:MAG: tetratricopeptide repeat protein [Calditrichaeota bacterium]|nr:tetratricopeptide repeat protein [Calditrichota bacterium]RQW07553.1 MAG: tetratricopeptide repeat protein [Calditrichota bacterium]